jgi:hypothetical protein
MGQMREATLLEKDVPMPVHARTPCLPEVCLTVLRLSLPIV